MYAVAGGTVLEFVGWGGTAGAAVVTADEGTDRSVAANDLNLTDNQREAIFNEVTWLLTTLREAQTSVYAVNPRGVGESVQEAFYYELFTGGAKKANDVTMGNLGLQVIAGETGGLVRNSTDVSGLLQECVEDNVAYYRLSFEPPPTEKRDVYHSLKVAVARAGATVSTSTGYYDQP